MREAIRRWLATLGGSPALPLTLDRRRIFVLPTGPGLAFGCALLAMLLTAINYTLSLGFALVFMLAGLGQVALLHAFRNLYALKLRETMPEPVFAGQHASFPLWLDNDASRPRPALQLTMAGADPVTIDLAPQQSRAVMLRVPTTRRGWLSPARVTLDTRYPLGLIRAWSYAKPAQRCLVLPQPESGRPPLPATAAGEAGVRPRGEGSEEFASLRDHRAADSPRHVAWKTSARTPDAPLLTKQFEGSDGGDLWLDLAQLPATLSLEQQLSRLTGWVIDADAAGLHYGLALPGTRIAPASGPAHRARVLRALALHGLPA
ncbi:MAG: DUF58 domain-containing protein [Methyloversatilis sp.]|uniref:DUF58 domain-containing protein n=1 Tax=Methyloversatilis sp. TaxID=2569862 RepID=UPI0027333BE6|nr:DUF58 domain-containing protein [Methyloversatilis sp.]MDP3873526.1 DUF58 domain-containing protein [Methyloversatilis sp.]